MNYLFQYLQKLSEIGYVIILLFQKNKKMVL